MKTTIFTSYTANYTEYAKGLIASRDDVIASLVDSFVYADKLDRLIEYCEYGVHATWVDADTEIHGIMESFIAPDGHIFVGKGYDTYFISVSPCERSLSTLRLWRNKMDTVRFDADALRPYRHLVTPVDTNSLLCHHMANIREGRVASLKRDSLKVVSQKIADERYAACVQCIRFQSDSDKCGTCGCSSTMTEASKSPWRKCPENRWPITSTDKNTH